MTWTDRVAVKNVGRIVAEGSPETIGGRNQERAVIGFRLPQDVVVGDVPLPRRATHAEREGRVTFESETPTRDVARLVAWAAGGGEEVEGLTVSRPTLEDAYLKLTDEEES